MAAPRVNLAHLAETVAQRALPEEHIEAYAAAAAAQFNHQIRDCLGRGTACEVFAAGTHGSMIERRERKEVTDELIAMAAGYLELADDWRLVAAMKAWPPGGRDLAAGPSGHQRESKPSVTQFPS